MVSRRKGSDERQKYWIDFIQRWQASGLSRMGFCKQEGVSDKGFYYWQRRLHSLNVMPKPRAKEMKSVTEKLFLPVDLKQAPGETVEGISHRLEIVTPGGYIVRIP